MQQTLPTYRVTWSPIKIGPFFLLVGAFFTGLGIGIKVFSDNVGELTLRYTHCESLERPSKNQIFICRFKITFYLLYATLN